MKKLFSIGFLITALTAICFDTHAQGGGISNRAGKKMQFSFADSIGANTVIQFPSFSYNTTNATDTTIDFGFVKNFYSAYELDTAANAITKVKVKPAPYFKGAERLLFVLPKGTSKKVVIYQPISAVSDTIALDSTSVKSVEFFYTGTQFKKISK